MAGEYVYAVVWDELYHFSRLQSRIVLAVLQQGAHVVEYLVFFRSAAFGSESIAFVFFPSAREIEAVSFVIAGYAVQHYFVPRIDLRIAACGEQHCYAHFIFVHVALYAYRKPVYVVVVKEIHHVVHIGVCEVLCVMRVKPRHAGVPAVLFVECRVQHVFEYEIHHAREIAFEAVLIVVAALVISYLQGSFYPTFPNYVHIRIFVAEDFHELGSDLYVIIRVCVHPYA